MKSFRSWFILVAWFYFESMIEVESKKGNYVAGRNNMPVYADG